MNAVMIGALVGFGGAGIGNPLKNVQKASEATTQAAKTANQTMMDLYKQSTRQDDKQKPR